jgi:hypothetical protein
LISILSSCSRLRKKRAEEEEEGSKLGRSVFIPRRAPSLLSIGSRRRLAVSTPNFEDSEQHRSAYVRILTIRI